MIEFLNNNGQLINVIASLGALISALVALFTLREIKNQRRSAYKPELILKSFTIEPSKSPLLLSKREYLNYKVSDFNDHSVNYNNVEFQVYPPYKINNLGFGIAKNVKCTWYFDHKKAISMITDLLPSNFEFLHHPDTGYYFLKNNRDEHFFYSVNYDYTPDTTDVIAPVQVQENNSYFSVPKVIVFTHILYLIFKEKMLNEKADQFHFFEFTDFPKVSVMIECVDLNDERYSKEIEFEVVGVASQVVDTIDMHQPFCMFQFNVK